MSLPNYKDIYAYVGATIDANVVLKNPENNDEINLTPYITFSSPMLRSHHSANISDNLVCTVTSASGGAITLTLDSANTSNLEDGKYVYHVNGMTITGDIYRLLNGVIYLEP